MDTIKLDKELFRGKPIFRGFESRIFLYNDNLLKIFYDDIIENKIKKIKLLSNLDEDIIKPNAFVIDNDNNILGYSMEYKKDFKTIDPRNLSNDNRIKYLLNLKEKLNVLHKNNIVYGDIKSNNILVNTNLDMYLCDLDNVQINDLPIDVFNSSTYRYKDNVKTIDQNLDNYMYNIYVLKILLGFHKIDESTLEYLYDSFYKRWKYDDDFREIIYNMINVNEENRENIKTLIKMP